MKLLISWHCKFVLEKFQSDEEEIRENEGNFDNEIYDENLDFCEEKIEKKSSKITPKSNKSDPEEPEDDEELEILKHKVEKVRLDRKDDQIRNLNQFTDETNDIKEKDE